MSQPFVGQMLLVGFTFAPRNYALAQGQLMAISQNTALFSLLGTTYGGNGTSTFQLPDLRGRVPIGFGQGLGLDNYVQGEVAGSETAHILISNLPAHNHVMTGNVSVATTVGVTNTTANKIGPNAHVLAPAQSLSTPPSPVEIYSDQTPNGTLGGVSSAVTSTLGTALTGSGLPFDLLQPYLVMNYVVALFGIFPSRN